MARRWIRDTVGVLGATREVRPRSGRISMGRDSPRPAAAAPGAARRPAGRDPRFRAGRRPHCIRDDPLHNVDYHDRSVEIPIGRKVADGFVQRRFAALPARITWAHSRGLTRAGRRRNLLILTESWNRGGVALHLLDLNVDTSTTMGRFFVSIIAAAAEFERSMGADRTRAALDQVKAQGGRLGRDAHGWRRLDAVDDCGRRVVEPVPGEIAAVERAVELRRSGATLAAVAQALNREGLPTKRGAVWRAGTVRAVLGRVG